MIDFLTKLNEIKIEDFYSIDLNNINYSSPNAGIAKNIDGMPGEEHYRLLCLMSTWVNNTVLYELGTYQGASSLCLAYNKTNRVITYDVEYQIEVKTQPNIEYRIGNYQYDKAMLESPIIFIDTTHDGVFEHDCYQYLIRNNYKGLTVWDDIHLNDEMKSFWNSVAHDKLDISKFGHWSGTGAIVFQ